MLILKIKRTKEDIERERIKEELKAEILNGLNELKAKNGHLADRITKFSFPDFSKTKE